MAHCFPSELIETKSLVERLASRRTIIRFLRHASDRRDIEDCKQKLSDAFEHLMVQLSLYIPIIFEADVLSCKLKHIITSARGLALVSEGVETVYTGVEEMFISQQVHKPDGSNGTN